MTQPAERPAIRRALAASRRDAVAALLFVSLPAAGTDAPQMGVAVPGDDTGRETEGPTD